jgi:hypothetical protein
MNPTISPALLTTYFFSAVTTGSEANNLRLRLLLPTGRPPPDVPSSTPPPHPPRKVVPLRPAQRRT